VNNRESTGSFWRTVNNINWYEITDADLKMEIYRANFTPGVGQFVIGDEPMEKLHLNNQSVSFGGLVGDHFSTGDKLTFTNQSGTISVGNRIIGNVSLSNANSYVMSVIVVHT
jgi:hypothetical protein